MSKIISKNNILFFVSLTLVGLLTCTYIEYTSVKKDLKKLKTILKYSTIDKEKISNISIGTTFPEIDITTKNNEVVAYPKKSNNKKIVVFSSSTCSYCLDYYSVLDSLVDTSKNIDVLVFQSDVYNGANAEIGNLKNHKFNMMSINDTILDTFNLLYTPTTFLLDKDNLVIQQFGVAIPLQSLQEIVRED